LAALTERGCRLAALTERGYSYSGELFLGGESAYIGGEAILEPLIVRVSCA